MSDILLCTDLDRTLIPNGDQPESEGARELFSRLSNSGAVELAYVTGRHLALILDAIEEYQLPRPDYVIADVGSTIFSAKGGNWERVEAWDNVLAADWEKYSGADIHLLLEGTAGIKLQEQEKQGWFKLSYYVAPEADKGTLLAELEGRLASEGIAANLVYSFDEEKDAGLLDVLPKAAGKLPAIRFLMDKTGHSEKEVIFAGDSGNDLDVLASPLPSVLVANASDQVRKTLEATPYDESALYLAKGGFCGMNGNYSAGILEGIAYYRPEILASIEGFEHYDEKDPSFDIRRGSL